MNFFSTTVTLGLVFGYVAVPTIACQDTEKAAAIDISEEVRVLVRQLDADSLEQREKAEKALIDLGPDVLAHLPQVAARTAAEVKVRLERITQTLEKKLSESTAETTRITLSGAMTLDAALEAIEKQTGNKFLGVRGTDEELQLNEDDQPFWPVVDRLLDAADVAVQPYGSSNNAIELMARAENQSGRFGHATYRGPFRFETVRLQASRDLRNPDVEGLLIATEVAWEPRLTPISVGIAMADLAIEDDNGQSIAVSNPEARSSAAVQPNLSAVELEIGLQLPPRTAKKIGKIKGTCDVMMPGRVETFEFPPLGGARETQLRKAGVTVVLEGVRKNQDLYEVRMRVQFDNAGNALESHRNWIFDNDAYLKDDAGKRVDSIGQRTTRQEQNAVGIAYLFDLSKPPGSYQFVYRTPTLILRRRVPFELTEIDLP